MHTNVSLYIKTRSTHIPFFLALFCRYTLSFLLWGGMFIQTHDALDSEFVYSTIIGKFWSSLDTSVFDVFLNGNLDWSYFARSVQPQMLLWTVLTPEWAYIATDLSCITLGYFGTYKLLRMISLSKLDSALFSGLFAFSISYTILGFGYATTPLIIYICLRKKKARHTDYIISSVSGLNSALAIHAIFTPVVVILTRIILGTSFNTKKCVNIISLYILSAMLGSFSLIYNTFTEIQSHRTTWNIYADSLSLHIFLKHVFSNLTAMASWYHAIITPAYYPAIFLTLIVIAKRKFTGHALLITTTIACATAIKYFWPIYENFIPGPLRSIQLDRIGFYTALMTILLSARALISTPAKWSIYLFRITTATAILFCFNSSIGLTKSLISSILPDTFYFESFILKINQENTEKNDTLKIITSNFSNAQAFIHRSNTVNGYYKINEYSCLRKIVGTSKVMSFGVDPMIAPYNGIRAIDGYHNLYPATYKNQFRPVIEDKLFASESLRRYYDGWGSRVYSFADRATSILPNFVEARRLGATYVIANREIVDDSLSEVSVPCLEGSGLRLYTIISPHTK